MQKKIMALVLVVALVFSLTACVGASAATGSTGTAPDYSRKDCWYRIPEITKEVDTFFIYPTEYMGFNEGDPDYATLDNAQMRNGVAASYVMNAGAYGGETKDFISRVSYCDGDAVCYIDGDECEFGYRTSLFEKLNFLNA